jgi:hypothetical protein
VPRSFLKLEVEIMQATIANSYGHLWIEDTKWATKKSIYPNVLYFQMFKHVIILEP